MKNTRLELVEYRLKRAWETLDDARILAENNKWNSTINRLYYSVYYAVIALLIHDGISPTTHNGAKINFTKTYLTSVRRNF